MCGVIIRSPPPYFLVYTMVFSSLHPEMFLLYLRKETHLPRCSLRRAANLQQRVRPHWVQFLSHPRGGKTDPCSHYRKQPLSVALYHTLKGHYVVFVLKGKVKVQARKVAGSAKNEQSKTVRNCVVL